ncbi:MAG: aminoacyl-tRNA hydrolase, partial [Patescibacteria group bacterium]
MLVNTDGFGRADYTGFMRLIIGLGNPGEEYENSRHCVGFVAVDEIAKKEGAKFSFEKKFNAEVTKSRFNDKPVILAKPFTFVNKSGEAVRKLKLFYKIKPADVIVIHDDLDIEFGSFKLSFAKHSGGHRGVQSVIDGLKTDKFWRLRIGTANKRLAQIRKMVKVPTRKASRGSSISRREIGTKKEAVGDFVLSRFTPAEQSELKKIIK